MRSQSQALLVDFQFNIVTATAAQATQVLIISIIQSRLSLSQLLSQPSLHDIRAVPLTKTSLLALQSLST